MAQPTSLAFIRTVFWQLTSSSLAAASTDSEADGKKPKSGTYIGGQAVIEGVMMRAPHAITVAVRKPDGTLAIAEEPAPKVAVWTRKVPLVRGVMALVESMRLGYRSLNFSASQQVPPTEDGSKPEEPSSSAAFATSMLLAIVLFMALPQGLALGFARLLGLQLEVQDPLFHLFTGGFKLTVFFAYILIIRQIPDVKRVFQYHGAEHKTIFAYEAGQPLTVQNVKAQSTLHPRCGTTFLVLVIAVSIIVGSVVVPLVLPNVTGWLAQGLTLLIRLALMPLIAGISYEFQRFTARYCTRGIGRVLLWPGFLFQKITTAEPDDDQIEVAIASMENARIRSEANENRQEVETPRVRVFGSLSEAMSGF